MLDETESALRLLLILYKAKKPIATMELYDKAKTMYNIGKYSIKTAENLCIKLGLVKIESMKVGRNPKPSVFHSLTDKGKKVAKIIYELEKALS